MKAEHTRQRVFLKEAPGRKRLWNEVRGKGGYECLAGEIALGRISLICVSEDTVIRRQGTVIISKRINNWGHLFLY